MRQVEVRLLGTVELLLDGTPVAMPPSMARLTAMLALRGPSLRSVVAETLWPNASSIRASGNLRSALWRAQQCVPDVLNLRGELLTLRPDARVDVHAAAALACQLLEDAIPAPHSRERWSVMLHDLLPYEDGEWAVVERERHRQLRLHALEALSLRLTTEGRFSDAIDVAHAAVAAEPLRESAHRCLIRAHRDEGNAGEALRAYERFARLLYAELGLLPSPALRRLIPIVPGRRVPGDRSVEVSGVAGFAVP